MAEGRLLKKSIASDERVAQLTIDSQLLYAFSIPFLDNEGRMPGEPGAVRSLAAKLLPWSDPYVDALIAEWTHTTRVKSGQLEVDPLVIRYPLDPPRRWRDKELQLEFECYLALAFQGFHINQPLRLRRGAHSTLPPPDTDAGGQLALMGHDAHVDHLAAKGTMGTPPSKEIAYARGLANHPRRVVSEELAAAASESNERTAGDVAWLRDVFAQAFGRQAPGLAPERANRLTALIAMVGRDTAAALVRQRAASGSEAKSLAYFLPALEEHAALVRQRAQIPGPTRNVPAAETDAALEQLVTAAAAGNTALEEWAQDDGMELDDRTWRELIARVLDPERAEVVVRARAVRRRELAEDARRMMSELGAGGVGREIPAA